MLRIEGMFVLAIVAVAALAAPRAVHSGAGPAAAPFSAGGTHAPMVEPLGAVRPERIAASAQPIAGSATFYADAYHGQTMANGARFDMQDASVAASNRWPLGTRLRLTRVAGGPWDDSLTQAERERYFGRSLEVTVQDRGAFNHELDLSLGAFRVLGRPDEGVIRIAIEPVNGAPSRH
jgi:rare lipoprotein A